MRTEAHGPQFKHYKMVLEENKPELEGRMLVQARGRQVRGEALYNRHGYSHSSALHALHRHRATSTMSIQIRCDI